MSSFIKTFSLCLFFIASLNATAEPLVGKHAIFEEGKDWVLTNSVTYEKQKLSISKQTGDILVIENGTVAKPLVANQYLGDAYIEMDFLHPTSDPVTLFLQGRYAIELNEKSSAWQSIKIRFRAPRFDPARNKLQSALLVSLVLDNKTIAVNELKSSPSVGALTSWEDNVGPLAIKTKGAFAIRNIKYLPADFSALQPPKNSGEATNENQLKDFVALGKETFETVGCSACHVTEKNSNAASTGPNLFGLFKREARDREVIEGGEGHKVTIKANRAYLMKSVREPAQQIAIRETGDNKGEAYLPVMPPFSAQTLSNVQIDAIGDYLATLNDGGDMGPAIYLKPQEGEAAYDPLKDSMQLIVNDRVRVQRGPMPGVSGRAIHVGSPAGVNYSFDPRLLAITKIWQGGFLDMSGEWTGRGGRGLKMGYDSKELNFGAKEFLLAPLNAQNQLIDFSFKDAKFGDVDTMKKSLYSTQDHLTLLANVHAQFEGYSLSSAKKNEWPRFRYSVEKNHIAIQTNLSPDGTLLVDITADNQSPQAFALNKDLLNAAQVTLGQLEQDRWLLPKGKIHAQLTAKLSLVQQAWHAEPTDFHVESQPLKTAAAQAALPAGYSIENYYAPLDNRGREQIFEALGLAESADNTLVVATRTAGIWRLVKNKSTQQFEWKQFAEGCFDSLGVVVEDKKGLVVVAGQKAELTRIRDTDGDGIADDYETLFDAHSYNGNYHSYVHGPVKGADGNYYIGINLAHGIDNSTYNAGGAYMGTTGGFAGWAVRVTPNKEFTLWANGLRSPASWGVAPDKKIWFADNQGEFVGTSKLFQLTQNQFYSHPASLVDLPGMTPDSPEIQWDQVKSKRAEAAVLFPHNRVANSPGNLAWDLTHGKFGPYENQIIVGDQTQSNLMRITTETVGAHTQGVVMPFMEGLESGVMRPLFLHDGTLLLGQTGRGWQAKGGHLASLQHVRWDGKTVAPAIKNVSATSTGFAIEFTAPVQKKLELSDVQQALQMDSWVYRDAPAYGSDELSQRKEIVNRVQWSADGLHLFIELATLEQPKVHPEQTARVYQFILKSKDWFATNAPETLRAYYSLYEFPKDH